MKKILALILSITMLLGVFSASSVAYAYSNLPDTEIPWGLVSGKCGNNVNYELNKETGELKFTGTGEMYSYNNSTNKSPFFQSSDVKNITIAEGITSIAPCLFYSCTAIYDIAIPNSVTSVGDNAFYACNSLVSIYYYSTQEKWNEMAIGTGNDCLFEANLFFGPDTEVLDYLLSIIDGYSPEDFSDSTYNELMNRINSIPDDLTNLSQKQVDSIVENILDGMNGLDPYLEFEVNAPNGSFTVQYDDESNVKNENSVLYGTSVTLTATPNEGYKFVGWYDTVNNLYFSKNSEYTFTVIANTYLKAVFVKNDSSTLTFTTYTNWVKSTVTKTLDEWKNMNSIAEFVPEVPYRYGYTNGRWVYDEADVLAKLQAGEDVSIIAEYDKKNVELPTPPTPVNNEPATELHYDFDEEASTGSFLLAVGLPEDCRVESMGILFYYDDAQTFDPTNFTLFITNKMMASRFNVGELNGVCISNIRNMSSDYNWVARGYVSYYEDDGSLVTLYSNQIEVVDRHQI
ncbi:MAG: leucine-rich repeat protein [Eubacterium coprostanoligenes]|uniref:InlB B-repeat-containing protein n=1 Tax=Eubacterium coprostanoligenes TaxID=290054 RepID=UPI0024096940|nr:leucine-rich repeat protein [Eubacterium coprostanoligenes]MDD6665100.1 leucine-rich repeat protein [Eubacterium coprostanoligenes]